MSFRKDGMGQVKTGRISGRLTPVPFAPAPIDRPTGATEFAARTNRGAADQVKCLGRVVYLA